nr:hypothetical protein [Singulisphaera acidiphila]
MPQPREDLDPRPPLLGGDQGPDHALQREAAVEDGQMPAPGRLGLLVHQLDGQLALGAEDLFASVGPGAIGQLRLAEVETPGDRQEPGRPLWFVE